MTPFGHLALVHALSSSGDAMVAVALAGSVFFNVSPGSAANRVALSLALTVAPFAIVGPFLGRLAEKAKGGRQAFVIASSVGRALCCFFMAYWVHSLVLFPIAFFALVFSKLYLVAKAALVPGTVERPGQLVAANSKLSVGGSLAGTIAGGLAAGLLHLVGAAWLLRADIAVYIGCTLTASQLASVRRLAEPQPPTAGPSRWPARGTLSLHPGLPPGGLQLAAVATATLRASVGFVTFLLVFTFRHNDAALIWYGLALGASQVGNVAGALAAPPLRRRAREEIVLTASCAAAGALALAAGIVHWGAHWFVAVVIAGGIGVAAGSGKVAFDSMVQRDIPARARARSFARFESGFQLSWALGGLCAVAVPMALSDGFVATGCLGLLGAAAFAGGSVMARRGALPSWFPASAPRPEAGSVPAPGSTHHFDPGEP